MHPLYEYMVGDTVANTVEAYSNKRFFVAKNKFIIKECTQIYIGGRDEDAVPGEPGYDGFWEPHYKGLIKDLGNHLFDEDELCTTRMVLIEKVMPVFCA